MTKHLNQLELARRWAMSERTLERWRWAGGGPPYLKVGKRVVYREADVLAFEAVRLHQRTRAPVESSADDEIKEAPNDPTLPSAKRPLP